MIAYILGNLWPRLVLPKKIENWSQLPAAASEDGRAVGEALPVLLTLVGRAAIPPRIWVLQLPGRVRTAGSPGRKDSEEKEDGQWGVPELRNRPLFMVLVLSADPFAKGLIAQGDCCTLQEAG